MKQKNPNTIKWFSLASIFFILLSFFIYWKNANNTNFNNVDDKEALKLYMQTKSALDTLSVQLNKAQNSVNTLNEFEQVKEKIFKN